MIRRIKRTQYRKRTYLRLTKPVQWWLSREIRRQLRKTEMSPHRGKLGRPSKLDAKISSTDMAYQLALLGATDADLARAFNTSEMAIRRRKRKDKIFRLALQLGKEPADAKVASRLYKRALGYSHPDVHVAVVKSKRGTQIIKTPLVKHYAPDTTACQFWLKNRQPVLWRDRFEHSGPDGKPIAMSHHIDLSNFTDEELAVMEAAGIKLRDASKKKEQ